MKPRDTIENRMFAKLLIPDLHSISAHYARNIITRDHPEHLTTAREKSSIEQLYLLDIERLRLANNCRVRANIFANQQKVFKVLFRLPVIIQMSQTAWRNDSLISINFGYSRHKLPLPTQPTWILTSYEKPGPLIIPMTCWDRRHYKRTSSVFSVIYSYAHFWMRALQHYFSF